MQPERTLGVKEETWLELTQLKLKMKVRSLDDVIKKLLEDSKQ